MSVWGDLRARTNPAFFAHGEAVTYVPSVGDAIETRVLLLPPQIDQAAEPPAYYADIEVDPLIVTTPKRKDEVVFGDGKRYVVALVKWAPYNNPILALHQKFGQRVA